MPSSHHILCRPLLLPPIPPSIRVFSNESTLRMRWPKYWSFSFSVIPSRADLLQNGLVGSHSSKASTLRHSAFFRVQLSHPYVTTGKTVALTRGTFIGKVMSLLFNMLFRLVITFLPRSKRLLISWLAVTICSDFGAPKNKKSDTVYTVSPSISHEVMGPDAMIFLF